MFAGDEQPSSFPQQPQPFSAKTVPTSPPKIIPHNTQHDSSSTPQTQPAPSDEAFLSVINVCRGTLD
jgi:hypothetical protein